MSENLTTAERDGLAHWSLFGRKLTPPSQRVDGSKYKLKIFEKPVASPWYQVVPRSQLSKLLVGFAPREMEDKWIVFADGPDDVGRATVHMCRSWTGHEVLKLELTVPVGKDVEGGVDARFTEIVWESSLNRYRDQTEEGAKELAREVCRWCMDVELP